MARFLVRRMLFGVFSLFAATVIVFGLSRLAGNPLDLYAKPGGYGITPAQRAALSRKLGLDRPLPVQYIRWVGNFLRGNLGETLLAEQPVAKVIGQRIGATVQLGMSAWIVATLVGIPLGVLSAVKRGSIWDYVARLFALFGQALPAFWIGMVGILLFSVKVHWLPAGTRPVDVSLAEQVKHFILPTITLAWLPTAGYLRLTRSAMLEVLGSEYVKLARAKGVRSSAVIWKHALRNALLAPLTNAVLLLGSLMTGAVVVETVFSWPGLGRLAIQSVWNNDFPVLTAVVLLFAVVWVVMNLGADLLYAAIDPRIRYT